MKMKSQKLNSVCSCGGWGKETFLPQQRWGRGG